MVTTTIDRSDATFKTLSGLASRVSNLLKRADVQGNPHLVGALDDFLGALYALIFAKQGGFDDRPKRSIDVGAISRRAEQLAVGTVRTDGKWMAGFHVNSAIFRLAAVYHRLLKVAIGRPNSTDYVPVLRTNASKLFRRWTNRDWSREHIDRVHAQVNELKHVPKGVFHGRHAKYSDAVGGARELLDLVDAWLQR